MSDDPYASPRAARDARVEAEAVAARERRRRTIAWALVIVASVAIGGGQLLQTSGAQPAIGLSLVVAGGALLFAVIVRAALAGLPRRKR